MLPAVVRLTWLWLCLALVACARPGASGGRPCADDSQCEAWEECRDRTCQAILCQRRAECPGNTTCLATGRCGRPQCGRSEDCPLGQLCRDLACHGAPAPDGGDAGGTLRDAGAPAIDGGPAPSDGGPALPDGGPISTDGGPAAPDGGPPAPDGGPILADGGVSAPDGGAADAGAGRAALGEDCRQDPDCATGACLGLSVAGSPAQVCVSLCCSENECPPSFGCLNFRGVFYCLPDRIFPSTVRFQNSAGQSCGPAGTNYCKSGLCDDSGGRRCLATCCRDANCGARTCLFETTNPISNDQHNLCGVNILGSYRTGQPCIDPFTGQPSELTCASKICLPSSISRQYECADTCCRNADCPGGFTCAQIVGAVDDVTSACARHGGGTIATGLSCNPDLTPSDCASGACAGGTCREPCCRDTDCPPGAACRGVASGSRIPATGSETLVRVCVPQ